TYAETYVPKLYLNGAALRALREDRYKLIDAPRPELYDLDRDPGETQNRLEQEPALANGLRAELERLTGGADSAISVGRVDGEAVEKLKALGYLGAGGMAPTARDGGAAVGGIGPRPGSSPERLPRAAGRHPLRARTARGGGPGAPAGRRLGPGEADLAAGAGGSAVGRGPRRRSGGGVPHDPGARPCLRACARRSGSAAGPAGRLGGSVGRPPAGARGRSASGRGPLQPGGCP